jgi:hypothetical protein
MNQNIRYITICINPVVHKFYENPRLASKFEVLKEWQKAKFHTEDTQLCTDPRFMLDERELTHIFIRNKERYNYSQPELHRI